MKSTLGWMVWAGLGALALIGAVAALFLISRPAPVAVHAAPVSSLAALPSGVVRPLPESVAFDPRQVELGKRLFDDRRLSSDGSVSCATCHVLQKYGTDGLPVSAGVRGRQGEMNAPSVFNCAFNFRQFWDGRADTLEDQIDGPVGNPREMDADWTMVMDRLAQDADLQRLARSAYGRPLDPAVVRSAIAAFERSLVTPDSPFDRYLRGDEKALSAEAVTGWRRFRELGCIACHQGVNLGGNMYATMGVMGDYFNGRSVRKVDLGLYNRTGRDEDKFKFKVPSLRNVAETGPYFHDGRVNSLDQAVADMARYQLGLDLNDADRQALIAFLNSLTGKMPRTAL